MKVFIGDYRDFICVSHYEDKWYKFKYNKYAWEIGDDEYRSNWQDKTVGYVIEALQSVLYLTINKFRDGERKVKIKLHDYDTWNADNTMAMVILPILKKYREDINGSPIVDLSDVPEGLHPVNPDPEEDNTIHQRWAWVVDEMIWTFETLLDPDAEDQFHHGKIDLKFGNIPDGESMGEITLGPNDTHWFDEDGWDKHNARITNGLRLFGKYFRNMWT